MRVHWLQHAEHEGLGSIGPWLQDRGCRVRHTALHAGGSLPAVEDFDWLIAMGGPMNIYEHQRYPWLIGEKALIRQACARDKLVLGICLGAQLMADVSGGRVSQNRETEIGWFAVKKTEEGRKSDLFADWPDSFTPFHWHEDTFSIPRYGTNLLESDACVNQAFALSPRQVGLQFHPEVRYEDVQQWLQQDRLEPQRFVQDNAEILRDPTRFSEPNRLLAQLLEKFAAA